MNQPVIAVVGATGAQGGGLVRAILRDPERRFRVRALTRDTTSQKARALQALGAELVKANLDDLESLERAFEGATGAFCVTFFWEHLCPQRERDQARKLASAAASVGLAHVIWSTLEDTRHYIPLHDTRMPTLSGEYKVPPMDAKGEADAFFTERGVPTTFLLTSFYWENFTLFGMGPQRGADGRLTLLLPMCDKPLPGVAAEDIGRCAYGIFKGGSEWVGKTVGVAGEHLTGCELAQGLSRVLGEEVHYSSPPPAVYRSLGFPGAADLGNMFQFKHDYNDRLCAARDTNAARTLNPELQDFATWLRLNGAKLK